MAKRSTWWSVAFLWVPSLYFLQGLPNAIVEQIAPVLFADLGISNALITGITAWIYLPWALKALWSPFIDNFSRKRRWTLAMQFICAGILAGMALCLLLINKESPSILLMLSIALVGIATASATHDIAADGFYMLALSREKQAFFSGIRSSFFRLAGIFGKGGIIAGAGLLIQYQWTPETAWGISFIFLAGLVLFFALFHASILPFPQNDLPANSNKNLLKNFLEAWKSFFQKKHFKLLFLFLIFYRFGEVQLASISPLFFKAPIAEGGLGLDNIQLGLLSGTIGTISLLGGGIIAGLAVARKGLRFWFFPMLAFLNLPDLIYVAFAHWNTFFGQCELPMIKILLGSGIAIEQFGYGFGFTGYMLYMLYACNEGKYKVAHYAICTGIMALGLAIPKFWCGALQTYIGYEAFFWWAMLCGIPAAFIVKKILKSASECIEAKAN